MMRLGDFVTEAKTFPLPAELLEEAPWGVLSGLGRLVDGILEENPVADTDLFPGVSFRGSVLVGRGCSIGEGSVIEGPAVIGDGCEIGTHIHIRPYTVLGRGCHVGHGSEVKASVVCDGAKIASLAFVGDSILGAKARVGSGSITANRGFSQGNICATVDEDGDKVDTGRDFFGSVIGDNSRLGANCTIQPGTLISPYCWVLPGTAVRGFVPEAVRVSHPKPLVFEDNGRHELS